MSHNVEDVKKDSQQLRGTLKESLASNTPTFTEDEKVLIKFHGMYQQDDRDERIQRQKAKQDPAWSVMVRSKIPGGSLTGEQYLSLDSLTDRLANGAMRITTRQDIQFHGVLKCNAKELLQRINEIRLTTYGGCGDVSRNVVACAAPFDTSVHNEVQRTAQAISTALLPTSKAYMEVWLNGEKVPLDPTPEKPDPLYGDAYLPRKFKVAIIVPPQNDVDIYAHDLSFVPHCPKGEIEGYTVLVGGGFGMDHGKQTTYPFLAVPIFYVAKEHVIDASKAVLTAFRDYGDRTNRKHARLKYVIAERGAEWFAAEVKARLKAPTEAPKPFTIGSVSDLLGWHAQGDKDGRWFCGVRVECGRIVDYPETGHGSLNGVRYRTGLRTIVQRLNCAVRLTANQNIIFHNIKPADKPVLDALLKEHKIAAAESFTQAHRMGIACVALPSCGLALSESERVFPQLMDRIDPILKDLKLADEHILFRMTGCPNGCARPYNADFAFVGRGIGKYAVYIGGSHKGDRMAGLFAKTLNFDDIPAMVKTCLAEFVQKRNAGETFSDYWGRTHTNGPAPHPSQFHEELTAREARLAENKAKGPIG
jgi:sulfite reductase beta subunit-like hemoprotein